MKYDELMTDEGEWIELAVDITCDYDKIKELNCNALNYKYYVATDDEGENTILRKKLSE